MLSHPNCFMKKHPFIWLLCFALRWFLLNSTPNEMWFSFLVFVFIWHVLLLLFHWLSTFFFFILAGCYEFIMWWNFYGRRLWFYCMAFEHTHTLSLVQLRLYVGYNQSKKKTNLAIPWHSIKWLALYFLIQIQTISCFAFRKNIWIMHTKWMWITVILVNFMLTRKKSRTRMSLQFRLRRVLNQWLFRIYFEYDLSISIDFPHDWRYRICLKLYLK